MIPDSTRGQMLDVPLRQGSKKLQTGQLVQRFALRAAHEDLLCAHIPLYTVPPA